MYVKGRTDIYEDVLKGYVCRHPVLVEDGFISIVGMELGFVPQG